MIRKQGSRYVVTTKTGRKHSEEYKKRMSEHLKGRKVSEETRIKIRDAVTSYYKNKK